MSVDVDCIVIGAGAVGLAIARSLQASGRDVVLVDKEHSFGVETSSRNSEVIHAGIYYDVGSVKAQTCVRGKELLYEYCRQRDIPHCRLGKLIVATNDAEIAILEKYAAAAWSNGVDDLRWLDRDQAFALEPEVKCVCALLSPSTGIIDSHSYMAALSGDFAAAGGHFVPRTTVRRGSRVADGILLELADDDHSQILARTVINSAGLHAPELAGTFEEIASQVIPKTYYAIGHYYICSGRSPFKRLVYPTASKGGLGVHATIDLAGAARFGPDVRWRERIDYSFDDSLRSEFLAAIRAYYPAMQSERLVPGYTGIRPKISGPSSPTRDFVIQAVEMHGVPGLINLFGIESPGLTASLAIAERVTQLANER